MKALAKDLERRDDDRFYGALACKLLVEGRCHRGTVRDFCARGMRVELGEELPPGAHVVVAFHTSRGVRFVLEGSARRKNPVAQSVHAHSPRSIALRLHAPPEAYLRWVDEAGRSQA